VVWSRDVWDRFSKDQYEKKKLDESPSCGRECGAERTSNSPGGLTSWAKAGQWVGGDANKTEKWGENETRKMVEEVAQRTVVISGACYSVQACRGGKKGKKKRHKEKSQNGDVSKKPQVAGCGTKGGERNLEGGAENASCQKRVQQKTMKINEVPRPATIRPPVATPKKGCL